MEREKPPYVPPMNGKEVLSMFGDRRLLVLEEQRERLGTQVDTVSKQIAVAQKDSEADWEEIHKMELDLHAAQVMLSETNRLIRKAAQDFGLKRGPVTLH